MEKENSRDYFNNAMSNFMHEMSGAGAIRHMVDQGYSIRQIMEKLDYPIPQKRVEETALKHMLKQGILVEKLPDMKTGGGKETKGKDVTITTAIQTGYRQMRMQSPFDKRQLSREIYSRKEKNGESMSYVLLSFTELVRDKKLLSCLNDREQDYLTGLPWNSEAAGRFIEPFVYHRLTGRMYEIALELSMAIENGSSNSIDELRFYFLESREEIIV